MSNHGINCVWKSVCGKYYARQVGQYCHECEVYTVDGKNHWVHTDDDPEPLRCVVAWGNHTKKKSRGGYGKYAFELSFVDNLPYAPRWKPHDIVKSYEVVFRKRMSFYHLPLWLKAKVGPSEKE